MPAPVLRRLSTAMASVLTVGIAACGAGVDPEPEEEDFRRSSPKETLAASYEAVVAGPYQVATTFTVNDRLFIEQSTLVDGAESITVFDRYLSVPREFLDDGDPESAESIEEISPNQHAEAIVLERVAYMHYSESAGDEVAEEFGPDAWFTADLTGDYDLEQAYRAFGHFDSAVLIGRIIEDLSEVQREADGVYTGLIDSDEEAVETLLIAAGASVSSDRSRFDSLEAAVALDDEGLLRSIEVTLPETLGMTTVFRSVIIEAGGRLDIAPPDTDNLHPIDDLLNPGG